MKRTTEMRRCGIRPIESYGAIIYCVTHYTRLASSMQIGRLVQYTTNDLGLQTNIRGQTVYPLPNRHLFIYPEKPSMSSVCLAEMMRFAPEAPNLRAIMYGVGLSDKWRAVADEWHSICVEVGE